MNILDTIITHKQKEVAEQKLNTSVADLEKKPLFKRQTISLAASLRSSAKTGIIAEYKRKSPSKGIINDRNSVQEVTMAYLEGGASGISVLTDNHFFGGSLDDLVVARTVDIPLLRKDFVIDEYQIIEARAFGADVILLIAACLSPQEVKTLSAVAKNLTLNVLLELHDETELAHVCDSVDMVGVNNRNLKNFEVNLEHSINLAQKIDNRFVKVAESGISDVATIKLLKKNGFDGFLIGEHFMKHDNPMTAFKTFTSAL